MAIYRVNAKLDDEQGRSTRRQFLFDVADEAALLVDAAAYFVAYQAMTKLGLISYEYAREVGVDNVPGAGSNVDPGATFLFATALPIDPTLALPDPVEAIKDGSGGIDLTDPLVTAWFALYNPGTARLNRNNPVQPSAIRRATLDV